MAEKNNIFSNFKLDSAEYVDDTITVDTNKEGKETEKVADGNPEVTDVDKVNAEKQDSEKNPKADSNPESKKVEKETKKVENEPEEVDFSFTPIVSHLASKNILLIDESKEYEDSEEGLEQVVAETIEARIKEKISSLPEDVQRLINLGLEGVDIKKVKEFEEIDFENIDLDDAENQEALIFDHLIATGHEKAEAEEMISTYKDGNLLAKQAKVAHKFLAKSHEKQKNEFIEAQKAQAKALEEEKKTKAEAFKKEVLETEKLGEYVIPKADRQKLYDYMTKPVKDGKTQSQLDDTPETRLLLAYLRMNKFNIKDIEKQVETKKSGELRKVLGRFKDTNAVSKTAPAEQEEKVTHKIPDKLPWM